MRVGFIGDATRLFALARQAGVEAVVWCGDPGRRAEIAATGATLVTSARQLVDALRPPRLFYLDRPLGEPIDRALDDVSQVMEPGDVVVDANRSYWGDTLRRARRLRHRALYYVDVAWIGPEREATWLVAGERPGVTQALPILRRLAAPSTVVAVGDSGAAHFSAEVVAALRVSFGHALSEARQLFEAFPARLDAQALSATLAPWPIGGDGRAAWLLDDAVRLEASVPHLAQAVMLELGDALDEHRSAPPPVRVGGFVLPDEER